jgi:hypothetical protein
MFAYTPTLIPRATLLCLALPLVSAAAVYHYEDSINIRAWQYVGYFAPSAVACDEAGTGLLHGFGGTANNCNLTCLIYNDSGVSVWSSGYLHYFEILEQHGWPQYHAYGLLLTPTRPIATFDFSLPGHPEATVNRLCCGGANISSAEPGTYRYLASKPGLNYYYCYRKDAGVFRICKMQNLSILASFEPAATPIDIACDAAGNVYAASNTSIYKYADAGALLTSWPVTGVRDLCLDAEGRVLILCEDNVTRVYDAGGSFLGSFAVNPSGDAAVTIAPNGRYDVARGFYGPDVTVDRYAPDGGSRVVPASLGRIKATYK